MSNALKRALEAVDDTVQAVNERTFKAGHDFFSATTFSATNGGIGHETLASEDVRERPLEQRADCVILPISSEPDEIRALPDRVAMTFEGRILGLPAASEASDERLGPLMAGHVEADPWLRSLRSGAGRTLPLGRGARAQRLAPAGPPSPPRRRPPGRRAGRRQRGLDDRRWLAHNYVVGWSDHLTDSARCMTLVRQEV